MGPDGPPQRVQEGARKASREETNVCPGQGGPRGAGRKGRRPDGGAQAKRRAGESPAEEVRSEEGRSGLEELRSFQSEDPGWIPESPGCERPGLRLKNECEALGKRLFGIRDDPNGIPRTSRFAL